MLYYPLTVKSKANILRGIITLTNDLNEKVIDCEVNTILANLNDLDRHQSAGKRAFAIKAAIALLSFSEISNLHDKASAKHEEKKQHNNKQVITQKMLLP